MSDTRPTRIRIEGAHSRFLTEGAEYAVTSWANGGWPTVVDNEGDTYHVPPTWFQLVPDVSIMATAAESLPSGAGAAAILSEAAGIVAGARNATHGDKERSFQVIADLWNAYLDGRKSGGPITPRDVAACMVLLKLARSVQGTAARDHFVDAAGYAAIAGELAAGEEVAGPSPYGESA